jgi:hypothetical protein
MNFTLLPPRFIAKRAINQSPEEAAAHINAFLKESPSRFSKDNSLYDELAYQAKQMSLAGMSAVLNDAWIEKEIDVSIASLLKRSGQTSTEYLRAHGREDALDAYRPIAAEMILNSLQFTDGYHAPLISPKLATNNNLDIANHTICAEMKQPEKNHPHGIPGSYFLHRIENVPSRKHALQEKILKQIKGADLQSIRHTITEDDVSSVLRFLQTTKNDYVTHERGERVTSLYDELAQQVRIQAKAAIASINAPPLSNEAIEKAVRNAIRPNMEREGTSASIYKNGHHKPMAVDVYRPIAAELAYQHLQLGMDKPLVPTKLATPVILNAINNKLCGIMITADTGPIGMSGTEMMQDFLNNPEKIAELKQDIKSFTQQASAGRRHR